MKNDIYVICINNKRITNKVTLNKKYKVLAEHNEIWKEGLLAY